jgi:branched-subunit amino acid transport protein AzlD
MSKTYLLTVIVASALVTYFLRALPFLLFHGERKMPKTLKNLGEILPGAIMAVLIIYCLKGAKSDPIGTGIPGLAAVLLVAFTYKWKHNTFFSIIAGTVLYMLLLNL